MRRSDRSRDVDVRRVIEDGLELVANEIRHRGQLETALDAVPPVHGVEGRIEQALLTLLIYAVRMLPERGRDSALLRVETGWSDDHAEVIVRCEGVSVGEPGAGRVSVRGGGGIGLAICGDILRSMGGDLFVSTEGETGASVFRVSLPLRAEVQPSPQELPLSEAPQLADERGRARILVIDDDPGVLGALRLMLQERHDVTTVQDPRVAVEDLLSGADYDVIFSDFAMPTLTGEDVYEAVKKRRPGFERRIVFMTGAAFQREAQGFFSRVDNRRMDKPFSLEQVEGMVRKVLATRARAT
jgi:CheY-like chemotaxis protein